MTSVVEVTPNPIQLFYSVTRVQVRTPAGGKVGTGFFLTDPSGSATEADVFLVTNRHVVQDGISGSFYVHVEGNPGVPKPDIVETMTFDKVAEEWFVSGDPHVDLALLPIRSRLEEMDRKGRKPLLCSVGIASIAKGPQWHLIHAVEELVFLGFPSGAYDKANMLPLARRALTATPPSVTYEGRPVFLIDGSIFHGSSGSPVFLLNVGSFHTPGGVTVQGGGRCLLLGVVTNLLRRVGPGQVAETEVPVDDPAVTTDGQPLDLGVVLRGELVEWLAREYNAPERSSKTASGGSS